jgi:phosphate starvation-inducible PhoH-like protein
MARTRQRTPRNEQPQPKADQFRNLRQIEAKSALQKDYLDSITNKTVTFGVGPAGTGKTFLAVYQALCHLWSKKCRRIIISRPVIEAGEKLGFLPGDLSMKMDPFIRPIMDSMIDIIGFDEMKLKMDKGVIEIAPLAFMRGRTFNDAFIILDESQNCTYEQLKMAVTRLGHNSKCVINGDPQQSDLPNSGLKAIIGALAAIEDVGVVQFTAAEVERSEIVRSIVKALEIHESKYGG